MRNIRLYVNGDPLIIHLEGDEPEIRLESSSYASRDRRITVYPFAPDGVGADSIPLDLRVEAV